MNFIIFIFSAFTSHLALAQPEILQRQILSMTFERPSSAEERMKEVQKHVSEYLSEIKLQKYPGYNENPLALKEVGDCLQKLSGQNSVDSYVRSVAECEELVQRLQRDGQTPQRPPNSFVEKQKIFNDLRYLLADSIEITTKDWVVIEEVPPVVKEDDPIENLVSHVSEILIHYQGTKPSDEFLAETLKLKKSVLLDDCELSQENWVGQFESLKGVKLVDNFGNIRPMIDLDIPKEFPAGAMKIFYNGSTTQILINSDEQNNDTWILLSLDKGNLMDVKRVRVVPILPDFPSISHGEYKIVEKNFSHYMQDEHRASVLQGSAGAALERGTYQLPFLGGIQGPQNRFVLASIRYLNATEDSGLRSSAQIATNGIDIGAGVGLKNTDLLSTMKINPANGDTSISIQASHKKLSLSYSDNLKGNRQGTLQYNQKRWRAVLISDLRSSINVNMRYVLKKGEVSVQTDLKTRHLAGLSLFIDPE